MDEIDKKAIEILLNAPFMTEEEMKNTIKILKQMARMKKNRGSIREILDYWANQAYILSMEA
jgi:ribosome recycling factor